MDETEWELRRLTGTVLSCAFRVSNTLGSGFLEKVYENALAIELREKGMCVLQQASVDLTKRNA
jgi:GxxExxY protein